MPSFDIHDSVYGRKCDIDCKLGPVQGKHPHHALILINKNS